MNKVIFPDIGAKYGNMSGVLVYELKYHDREVIKEEVTSLISGYYDNPCNMRYRLSTWGGFMGVIMPKAHPIDAIIGKIFKVKYHGIYYFYLID